MELRRELSHQEDLPKWMCLSWHMNLWGDLKGLVLYCFMLFSTLEVQ